MKSFVDYTSRKCFASARVARLGQAPWLRNTTHTRKISFFGLVIQITIPLIALFIKTASVHDRPLRNPCCCSSSSTFFVIFCLTILVNFGVV
jgi:hypothetical protein